MFFFKHRLKMTSLRIGKHRIVKNIASLRKVNIAHPYPCGVFYVLRESRLTLGCSMCILMHLTKYLVSHKDKEHQYVLLTKSWLLQSQGRSHRSLCLFRATFYKGTPPIKRIDFFRALPKLHLPPPPPNLGKYNFFWTSKTTFSAYYRTK